MSKLDTHNERMKQYPIANGTRLQCATSSSANERNTSDWQDFNWKAMQKLKLMVRAKWMRFTK